MGNSVPQTTALYSHGDYHHCDVSVYLIFFFKSWFGCSPAELDHTSANDSYIFFLFFYVLPYIHTRLVGIPCSGAFCIRFWLFKCHFYFCIYPIVFFDLQLDSIYSYNSLSSVMLKLTNVQCFYMLYFVFFNLMHIYSCFGSFECKLCFNNMTFVLTSFSGTFSTEILWHVTFLNNVRT